MYTVLWISWNYENLRHNYLWNYFVEILCIGCTLKYPLDHPYRLYQYLVDWWTVSWHFEYLHYYFVAWDEKLLCFRLYLCLISLSLVFCANVKIYFQIITSCMSSRTLLWTTLIVANLFITYWMNALDFGP